MSEWSEEEKKGSTKSLMFGMKNFVTEGVVNADCR